MATEEAVLAVIKSSRPTLCTPHDKVAFALHSTLFASGYSILATGPPAFADTIFSSPPSGEVGIEGWNETDEAYAFLYSKNGNIVLVKCLVMGDCLVINALCSKDEDKEISLQINVNDYDGENKDGTSYVDRFKNFGKLVKVLKDGVMSKVEDAPKRSSATATTPRSEQIYRSEQSRYGHQEPEPAMPGYERQEPDPAIPGLVVPPTLPFHFDDRFPGPGAGIYPCMGPGIGGSMLIGPGDPRYFPGQPGLPDNSLLRPPGARFDPFGPPGVPGFEPNRFVRNPRRPGTHPHLDLQQFGNPDDFI